MCVCVYYVSDSTEHTVATQVWKQAPDRHACLFFQCAKCKFGLYIAEKGQEDKKVLHFQNAFFK